MDRRLVTILAADVVGYSRLMGADEEATLATLISYREVIDRLVTDHRGRVFGGAGDSVVAEFASPVEAVRCAVKIQQEIEARNADLPEDRHMLFRIGVNLGDVMAEGDNLFGDGVNVAARLEELAEPGGVSVSGTVFDQVDGKLDLGWEDTGAQAVKNISKPVRVYQAQLETGRGGRSTATEALSVPDKPSIAVLPFVNMSGDAEQEYFSDGVTEDIITELSRFRELFVIARSSSFSYKGEAVKVQDIATDLGVRYVLEGSVRAARDQIRVTAQLIDGGTGHHIWAERYNREITDLFALQDEIAQTVAGTVAGRLKSTSEDRAERKPIESLEAYDYALRGQSIIADTKEDNLRARQAYEKAIELDPSFTRAYVGLALSYAIERMNHWWDPAANPPLDHALEYAAKAVSLDNTDSKAQVILGLVHEERGEYEEAKVHLERALELNPNDADAFVYMGILLQVTHKPGEAIDYYLKAMRLNPYYPAWYVWRLGTAYLHTRQYENAVISLKEALNRNPKLKRARLHLVVTYARLDRIEEARRQVEELLAYHPDASIKQELQWDFASDEKRDDWLELYRRAGLPE